MNLTWIEVVQFLLKKTKSCTIYGYIFFSHPFPKYYLGTSGSDHIFYICTSGLFSLSLTRRFSLFLRLSHRSAAAALAASAAAWRWKGNLRVPSEKRA
ncbi:hypothetical protein RIF29_01971 [Crotalaria pallida]|uniref:Uncharacterized protein n=1 Tax=Crotalaria pallida TaxID=3830 RepID=A0AAN9IXW8_CROPI